MHADAKTAPLEGIKVLEMCERPGFAASADPHYEARGMIEHHTLADGQAIDLPGIVPKLSGTPGRTEWLGPPLGAHTAEVLGSIGIDGHRAGIAV